MKIVAIKEYLDLELKRIIQPGEILDISQERGAVISDKGFAVAIPDPTLPLAEMIPKIELKKQEKRRPIEAANRKKAKKDE